MAAVALTLAGHLALDIGRGVPWSDGTPPVRVNWATNAEYRALADAIPDGAVVESLGEIGALAFYCADRCTVVDFLSDPGRMAPLIGQWRAEHPGLLADLNYRHYVRPEPVAVRYRIEFHTRPPQPGEFPASFHGREQRAMRLVELPPAAVTPPGSA